MITVGTCPTCGVILGPDRREHGVCQRCAPTVLARTENQPEDWRQWPLAMRGDKITRPQIDRMVATYERAVAPEHDLLVGV